VAADCRDSGAVVKSSGTPTESRLRYETTEKGVRVVETSPYVVNLIQAHADVVSAFITNGRFEMMKDHAVPARD
jgi:uncharacterized protein